MKQQPNREHVWHMFDRIAPRYDLLNRLLSFRQDVLWRKKMADFLKDKPQLHVLDMATGTADQLIFLCQLNQNIAKGVGMDMSENMLAIGREKIKNQNMEHLLQLELGDATHIPTEDDCFDVVTISFGIRNVVDVSQAITEMYRVLKPDGRLLILEFSLPSNPILRRGYLFYFRYILPLIGGVVSGDNYAYRYLNQTVETFPYGEMFCEILREVGFVDVQAIPLTFGIATIYQGDKPSTRFRTL